MLRKGSGRLRERPSVAIDELDRIIMDVNVEASL